MYNSRERGITIRLQSEEICKWNCAQAASQVVYEAGQVRDVNERNGVLGALCICASTLQANGFPALDEVTGTNWGSHLQSVDVEGDWAGAI
jgi:hypothetical protein